MLQGPGEMKGSLKQLPNLLAHELLQTKGLQQGSLALGQKYIGIRRTGKTYRQRETDNPPIGRNLEAQMKRW